MNNYLTYTAKAKLHHLINESDGVSAMRISYREGRFHFTYCGAWTMGNSEFAGRVMICNSPKIWTDVSTLRVLESNSIDYDYPKREFVLRAVA